MQAGKLLKLDPVTHPEEKSTQMAQELEALAALTAGPDLVPSTHVVATSCLRLQSQRGTVPSCDLHSRYCTHA